jgi:serine/threonine-protein kinase Chk1
MAANSSPSKQLPFIDGWDLMQTLGEGTFGEVKLAVNKTTKECVAVKVLLENDKFKSSHESLKKEICIMKMLKHEHIIRFYGERKIGQFCYLFLEYADGGELFDRIEPDLGMEPGQAHHFFKQLLAGVEYLHQRGVAHRDIKPENLLLDGYDVLKISDFGLSTVFRYQGKERVLNKCCGTEPYVAPEVYAGVEYNAEPADLWSCGIVLVALLAGELPWDAPSPKYKPFKEWCSHNFLLPPWNKISNEPLALLKKILKKTPSKRYIMKEIKDHIWYKKVYSVVKSPGHEEALAMVSPTHRPAKRVKIESSPRYTDRPGGEREVTSSQPAHRHDNSSLVDGDAVSNTEYFTQPSCFDELIVGTQLPCTPGASQTPFQRLALRMTRFYTHVPAEDIWGRLRRTLDKMGLDVKPSPDQINLTVSTEDRRSSPLVFKASLFEMKKDLILVEFRRSKGDGLEFKKLFKKIKDSLSGIVCRPPVL